MTKIKKIDNHTFYFYSYQKHGISAKGVHWGTKERQFLRFEVLIDFIKDELETNSILDIGSGYGDLITYFQEKNTYPQSYTGIDCEEFMIDVCKKRFPNSKFYKKNFIYDSLPEADYYVCSGALNILTKDEFLEAIKNCFNQSKKGFVFNFLTDAFVHGLTSFDVYMFCQKLTKNIDVKNGYLDNDYTIFLKK